MGTAKIKLVPQSQQNRLHLNEDTQKGNQNRVSRSTKSTSPKEEHCKNKYGNKIVSRGQRNRLHQKKNTARNKYASRSPPTTSFKERHPPEGTQIEIKKESSKTEGQKAAPIKNHENHTI